MAAPVDRRVAENLPNFRRVYPRSWPDHQPDVITGVLFRSSRPELLNEADAELIAAAGIRTIIDCRPVKEYLKLKANSFLDKYYGIYYVPEPFPAVKTRYSQNEPVELKKVISRKHRLSEGSTKKHICLDFFKMNYILSLIIRAPFHMLLQSLLYLIKDLLDFSANYYKNFVGFFADKFFNPYGLVEQYKNMIKWSQASICAALKILSDRSNLPAMINCSHGKDRTGILVMIILTVMGVPREEIIDDYTLSEEGLAGISDRVHHEICERYNMAEDFKTAKRETMRELLDYIDESYGSMDGYLDHIGFGEEERQRLRRNLKSFNK